MGGRCAPRSQERFWTHPGWWVPFSPFWPSRKWPWQVKGGGANLSGVVFLEALGSELADVVGWGCLRAEHMWASSLGGSGSGEGKVLGGSWKVPGEVGGLEVHQPLQKPAVTGTQGSHLVPPTPGGLNWGQEQAA